MKSLLKFVSAEVESHGYLLTDVIKFTVELDAQNNLLELLAYVHNPILKGMRCLVILQEFNTVDQYDLLCNLAAHLELKAWGASYVAEGELMAASW